LTLGQGRGCSQQTAQQYGQNREECPHLTAAMDLYMLPTSTRWPSAPQATGPQGHPSLRSFIPKAIRPWEIAARARFSPKCSVRVSKPSTSSPWARDC
jgi:hypothetical protein